MAGVRGAQGHTQGHPLVRQCQDRNSVLLRPRGRPVSPGCSGAKSAAWSSMGTYKNKPDHPTAITWALAWALSPLQQSEATCPQPHSQKRGILGRPGLSEFRAKDPDCQVTVLPSSQEPALPQGLWAALGWGEERQGPCLALGLTWANPRHPPPEGEASCAPEGAPYHHLPWPQGPGSPLEASGRTGRLSPL